MTAAKPFDSAEDDAAFETDVLVIGGGMAGGWAAIAAAGAGASVILVDKGYFGTSGVTATAGPGHWWVPPEGEQRAKAIRDREARTFGLSERVWMERILDETWRTLPTLSGYYEFPRDAKGEIFYRGLRGPEYLRALRRLASERGVRILDHSPALELLVRADGSVGGASGIRRQAGDQGWTIRAAGTILATGGCAFLSPLLGSRTNTGDGYLMAGEAGASLSGMEFSSQHTIAAAGSSQTRSAPFSFATFYDAAGRELGLAMGGGDSRSLAKLLIEGPVYCTLARMPADLRAALHRIQPAFQLPFERQGIDPFEDKFLVTLHGEGTIRGVGGLRIVNEDCETSVAGLFAAGDTATREPVAGATSGGGNQNSAWALTSGQRAGRAVARLAHRAGRRADEAARPIGAAGLRPQAAGAPADRRDIIRVVKDEMLPYEKSVFRTGEKLVRSLAVLDTAWRDIRGHLGGDARDRLKAREAAALVATARWCCGAALARTESRGMHRREDAPQLDPSQTHRLVVEGLDAVRIRPEPARVEAAA
jgi:succinate dehydrogenase/fumarate reductase flavoprotein subunit